MSPHALAIPQLADTPWIVALAFGFILITLFSIGPKGVLREQVRWISDTRNSRTFDVPTFGEGFLRPCLFVQTFLFEGLCLYLIAEPTPIFLSANYDAANHDAANYYIANHDTSALLVLAGCLLLPLLWYLFQWFCFHWGAYLFRADEECHILHRTFVAIHLLLGPCVMLLFLLQMTHLVDHSLGIILLCVLFLISQALFIFSGIKIFLRGISSLCVIILYICALEIAPLYILLQKLAS